MQIPVGQKVRQKGCGFKSRCWQNIFSNIFVKAILHHHPVDDFRHHSRGSFTMNYLSYLADVPQIRIKSFKKSKKKNLNVPVGKVRWSRSRRFGWERRFVRPNSCPNLLPSSRRSSRSCQSRAAGRAGSASSLKSQSAIIVLVAIHVIRTKFSLDLSFLETL